MATSIHQGRKEIAVTGTAVAIGAAKEVNWLILVAELHNKRPLAVGSSTVTISETVTDGPRIEPSKSRKLDACDIGDVYINGFAGDSIFYIASSTD